MGMTPSETEDVEHLREGERLIKQGLDHLRAANRPPEAPGRAMGSDGHPGAVTRSRELSVAITHIESGALWLPEAEAAYRRS